ncbi:MAG: hypothetical protein QOD00_2923 [Blastocatellia bacterium]|nr:hypothetical protein [Blastocatellia bacterium]
MNNELLSIEWPEENGDDGRGLLLDVFFKFCAENSITIGQQVILLALFECAGADLSARISEKDFAAAMESMRERADGKINFMMMQGYSDQ